MQTAWAINNGGMESQACDQYTAGQCLGFWVKALLGTWLYVLVTSLLFADLSTLVVVMFGTCGIVTLIHCAVLFVIAWFEIPLLWKILAALFFSLPYGVLMLLLSALSLY